MVKKPAAKNKRATLRVPIFPLPTAILFPKIYLPLHIFEERYKQMLSFIEESESLLGVSFSPELDKEKFYPHRLCSAGVVRTLQKFDDGRSDILVLGTKRLEIKSWVQEEPFFIAEAEVLELDRNMPEKTEKQLLQEIKEMLVGWIFGNFNSSNRAIQYFQGINDLEPLANFVANYFIEDINEKQRLLEILNLEELSQEAWKILKNTSPDLAQQQQAIIFPGEENQKNVLGLSSMIDEDDGDGEGPPPGALN